MATIALTPTDVAAVIPTASNIVFITDGGQKRVFRAELAGRLYAIKFMRPTVQQVGTTGPPNDASIVDDVTARARREVETMKRCQTPHLVKQGPIGLTPVAINDEQYLYFTEEFIEGSSLAYVLRHSPPLTAGQLVRLGTHITLALEELWSLNRIHRDVKPANIMMRTNGDFVLLDMGLVFDFDDRSFSLGPVGTTAYFSPEQMDFANRRSVLDFRSDTFSLGIVLYQMAVHQHPFASGATNSWELIRNIQVMTPVPPKQLRNDLPDQMDSIILRLLGKRPALRYRTPQTLLKAFTSVPV